MKKLLIILLFPILITCDFAGNEDTSEATFLETNNEIIWQSTEEYYEGTYIGFSNNITEALFISATVYTDNKYCEIYKKGENKIPNSAECRIDDGELTGASAIYTYTIITNAKNLLVLDLNTYDESCGFPFSYDTRYSYFIDGDFLFETIEEIGYETELNEYVKTYFSYDYLCEMV